MQAFLRFFRVVAILAVPIAGLAAIPLAASASQSVRHVGICLSPRLSWPQFRYDSAHDGFNSKGSCLNAGNVRVATRIWHHGADGVYSDPIVGMGKVILSTRRHGRCSGIEAIDAGTGQTAWTHKISAAWCGDPLIAGTEVVLIQRNPLFLQAWSLSSGSSLWRKSLPPASWSSPTLYQNGLLVLESGRGQVRAVNPANGKTFWTMKINASLRDFTPAIHNNRVYVTSAAGRVYALTTRGKRMWSVKTGGSSMMGPATLAATNTMLFIACSDGKIYGVNLKTHKLAWKASFAQFNTDLATDGSRVYATSPPNGPHGHGSSVYALNASTGKMIWSFGTGFVGEKPEAAGGLVFVSNDGVATASRLFALNATTGKEIWSIQGAGSYPSYPAVTGNSIFLSNYAYAVGQ